MAVAGLSSPVGQSALAALRTPVDGAAGRERLRNDNTQRVVVPPSVRNGGSSETVQRLIGGTGSGVTELPGRSQAEPNTGLQPFGTSREEGSSPISGGRPGQLIAGNGIATASDASNGNAPPAQPGSSAPSTGGLDARETTVPEDDGTDANGLTEEEQEVVRDLKARDAEVRRHEQAHAAVGGQYAGQPTYTYQTGPDGQRYAIGGPVSIDSAPIGGDPEATIRKLEIVRRAALAPAEPSPQDRRVAAQASAGIVRAQGELATQRQEEREAQLAESDEASAEQRDTRPGVDPADRADTPFEPAEVGALDGAETESGFGQPDAETGSSGPAQP